MSTRYDLVRSIHPCSIHGVLCSPLLRCPCQVDEREYNGQVIEVRLNGTSAAVLSGTKVILQQIELGHRDGGVRGRPAPGGGVGLGAGPGPRRTFPEREDREHGEATSVGLTEAFLVYGTRAGTLEFFCLSEWAPLAGVELKHKCSIKRVWPNYLGTRVLFTDAANTGWLYSPAGDKITQVNSGPQVRMPACGIAEETQGAGIRRASDVYLYWEPFGVPR